MISTSSGSSRRYQWTSPFCPALLFPLLRSTLLYSTPKSPYIGSFSTKFPLIRSEIQWAQLPVSGILETLKRELFFDLASSWGLWHEYIVDIYFGFYRGKGVVFGSLAVCFCWQCLYLWLMTSAACFTCVGVLLCFWLRNFWGVNGMGGSMIKWMGWNYCVNYYKLWCKWWDIIIFCVLRFMIFLKLLHPRFPGANFTWAKLRLRGSAEWPRIAISNDDLPCPWQQLHK